MTALLLAYLLIALAQVISYGRFELHALILVMLGLSAGVWAVLQPSGRASSLSRPALVLGVGAMLLTAMVHNPLTYCRVPWWPAIYGAGLVVAVALIASYAMRPDNEPLWWRSLRFVLLLAMVVGMRVGVPFLSPTPGEDVWVVQQEAARAVLSGVDPYSVAYPQIFAPEVYETFGYRSGFHYPPLSLIPIVPALALFGDIRWAYVVCELLLLLALWRFSGRAPWIRTRSERELILWLWGFNTSILFILEHSWTEPFGLALLAGFLAWSRRRRAWPAAICLAAFFSYKQYTLLMFPLLFFLPQAWHLVVCFTAMTVVSYLPWLIAGSDGLVASLLEPWRARPRADGLSLAALWMNARQTPMPQWVNAFVLLGGMHLALSRIVRNERGLVLALWTVLAALFITAKQSFCNYYYFLSFLVLVATLMTGGEPEEGTESP